MKKKYLMIASFLIVLSGCGVVQGISESSVKVSNSIFKWDVRTLHLDFTARAELNTDEEKRSSSLVIRVYQLTESDTFAETTYQDLVEKDNLILDSVLKNRTEIILKPDTAKSVDIPLNKDAEYVGIIALFKMPNLDIDHTWRKIISKDELYVTKPQKILIQGSEMQFEEEE